MFPLPLHYLPPSDARARSRESPRSSGAALIFGVFIERAARRATTTARSASRPDGAAAALQQAPPGAVRRVHPAGASAGSST
ncbi:MAG: hypothetical protein MZW92_08540 [Comamonadaceae bacterium]|nr:hypothetical protein [Comamonadaceae bacterium]